MTKINTQEGSDKTTYITTEISTEPVENADENWVHLASVVNHRVCRIGWPGVLDAIKAALKGDDRPMVAVKSTLEMWVNLNRSSEITNVSAFARPELKEPATVYVDGFKLREHK